jgi:hypothetical protein
MSGVGRELAASDLAKHFVFQYGAQQHAAGQIVWRRSSAGRTDLDLALKKKIGSVP